MTTIDSPVATYSVAEYRRYTTATQWLNTAMAVVAVGLGIFILIDPVRRTSADWVFWLIWPIATLHTIEEYVIPGGFLRYINSVVFGSADPLGPLTARRAFFTDAITGVVNPVVVAVMSVVYLPAMWFFVSVLLINGFFHLTVTLTSGRYFPGAVTGTLLYVPAFAWITYFYVDRGLVGGWDLLITFLLATAFTGGFFWQVRRWGRADAAGASA